MENKTVTSYDYKTVRVRRETESMLCDSYSVLGWEVVNTTLASGTLTHVNVSFKRDRKIKNKSELLKLQSRIDSTILNIEKMQVAQKNAGVPEAITVGTIGTLTLGGGMSMVMTLSGVLYTIVGSVIGVVGIGIGLLGWLTYNKVHTKKLTKLEPLIETEFSKLSDLCDEAITYEK